MSTKVPTISHDDALEPDPAYGDMIPPYDVSEQAKGKTTAELYQDVLDDRAMKRATGGLLDHRSLTLEFLWAESIGRGRWSDADRAAQPTDDESKRLAAAETAYLAADAARKAAAEAVRNASRAAIVDMRKVTGDTAGALDYALNEWQLRPSTKPAAVKAGERSVEEAQRRLEAAEKACGEALVRLNNVRANQAARQQGRRQGAQASLSRTAFLENVRRSGGQLTAKVKEAMNLHYGRG